MTINHSLYMQKVPFTIQKGPAWFFMVLKYNNHNETTHLGCQHFEMPNVMQATYFGSLFDIYLAFRNVNEMYCKYIYSGGYAKCKCNANVMQMKCNANKCKKMHSSGNDPLKINQLYVQ